jgi:uncharacterized surface protein with fasciclin (FAS1) repeats
MPNIASCVIMAAVGSQWTKFTWDTPTKNLRIKQLRRDLFMISRRFRNVAVMLAILALIVAACGPQATPTATTAPTDAPTEEATEEAVVEEATEEAVVEEATEEAVVEEATEEAVVEEATEEAVVEEATEEAVVEEATEEVVVEEATEEAVVEVTEEAVAEPTEEAVVEEATEAAPEATEAPITDVVFTDGNLSFTYPSNYELNPGNGVFVLTSGEETVVVVNETAYNTVLGGVSFDDNAAALAFYLDRTGYTVGEATADGVAVELPRRNQSGVATLVDLGGEQNAVVITLAPAGTTSAAAAQILETISIPSITTLALTTDGLGTLGAALARGGYARTFNSAGEYTVFAPSDEAFAAALEAMGMTADELLANQELLDAVLPYHVVEGIYNASELTDGLELTTLSGGTLMVHVDEEGTVTLMDAAGNSVGFVSTDTAANNGVIHVIDGVLSPVAAEATPEATAEATEAGS